MVDVALAKDSAGAPHLARLDSIRILAAFWVAASHGLLPLKPLAEGGPVRTVLAFVQGSFDGVAAVMVFFIISGICIHLPYSGRSSIPLSAFLVRRYVRVGLPLAAIVAAAHLAGTEAKGQLEAVTWSVYAELFYYSAYPVLFQASLRWGWVPQIVIFSLVSIFVSFWFVREAYLPNLALVAWLWGLPVWISGCLFAEWFRRGRFPIFPGSLVKWRIIVWLSSVAATWLVFHSPVKVGYQFSMLVFSPLAFAWLAKELTAKGAALSTLEICGLASYSLYLVHPVALGAWIQHGPILPPAIDLISRVGLVALATVGFFFVIEAPSHQLARLLSRALATREAGPPIQSIRGKS